MRFECRSDISEHLFKDLSSIAETTAGVLLGMVRSDAPHVQIIGLAWCIQRAAEGVRVFLRTNSDAEIMDEEYAMLGAAQRGASEAFGEFLGRCQVMKEARSPLVKATDADSASDAFHALLEASECLGACIHGASTIRDARRAERAARRPYIHEKNLPF